MLRFDDFRLDTVNLRAYRADVLLDAPPQVGRVVRRAARAHYRARAAGLCRAIGRAALRVRPHLVPPLRPAPLVLVLCIRLPFFSLSHRDLARLFSVTLDASFPSSVLSLPPFFFPSSPICFPVLPVLSFPASSPSAPARGLSDNHPFPVQLACAPLCRAACKIFSLDR